MTMNNPRTGSVEGIEVSGVSAWLEAEIPDVTAPFSFELIPAGHSNMTFRVVDAAGRRLVLRRPPLGAVLATAHDMSREHRIIAAVGPTDVPVPAALGLCEDDAINGAPFYVMDFVDGQVLVTASDSETHFTVDQRSRISESVVSVMAALHAVDPDAIGLGTLGKKEAYLARQLKRWRRQWADSKTRDLETMETVSQILEDRMPEQIGASIVHGDFRLGNFIAAPDARIAAVLDWELCTLGDPLADVGFLLNDWVGPGEAPFGSLTQPGPSGVEGFWSRDQMVAAYEELSGRSVGDVDYYRAFQYWRLAAIVEGVLARFLKGVMGKETDTDGLRRRVEVLSQAALDLLRSSA